MSVICSISIFFFNQFGGLTAGCVFFVVLSKGRATCITTSPQSVFFVGYYSKFSWLLQVSKEVKRNNIIVRICGRNNDSNFEDQLHVVETIKG